MKDVDSAQSAQSAQAPTAAPDASGPPGPLRSGLDALPGFTDDTPVPSVRRNPHVLWFGVVLGIIGGYAYYYFWGCKVGCPGQSNPVTSIGLGIGFGVLLMLLRL